MTLLLTLALVALGATDEPSSRLTCEGTASYPSTVMTLPYGLTTIRPGLSITERIEIRQAGSRLRVQMPGPMTPRNFLRRMDVEVATRSEGGTILVGRGTMVDDTPVGLALDEQSGEIKMEGSHGTFSGRCRKAE